MALGFEQQPNLSWQEQDKVRRRNEIRDRLKQECIRKRWDPFRHMNKIPETDPAIDRYMDLRKKGRMPGAPFKPSLFYGYMFLLFAPIYGLTKLVEWERSIYIGKCERDEIPSEEKYIRD